MTFILQSGVLLHWYLIVQRRGLQDKVALCRSWNWSLCRCMTLHFCFGTLLCQCSCAVQRNEGGLLFSHAVLLFLWMQPIQLVVWVFNILHGQFPFVVVVGYVCILLVLFSSILTFFFFPQVLTTRWQDLPLFFWPPVVSQPLASMDGHNARLRDRICLWDATGRLPGIHEEWSKHDQEVHETLGQLCTDRVCIIR